MFLWLRPLHLKSVHSSVCHLLYLDCKPIEALFLALVFSTHRTVFNQGHLTSKARSFNRLKFFSWYVNSTEDSTVHGVYINAKNCDWHVAGCLIRWNRGIKWNIIGELPEELPWLHLDYYNSFWSMLRVSKPLSNECRDTICLIYHGISAVGL